MKQQYHMQEEWIPEQDGDQQCQIYLSKDFYTNDKKCLVLIQGTGSVRAG